MQTDSEPEELLPSDLDGLEADRAAAVAARTVFSPGGLLKAGRYRPFRKIGLGQFAHLGIYGRREIWKRARTDVSP
ncbi:hypothetical protein N7533_000660 [Penicillium manginii]|jgi:hypothetical protein|uniref:uncharacterized protein n=1 Tax=Penicillium manginii TaxID=203109 RepID=UPI002548A4E9|nr:uncharacterized protein N7533_000660 [Penicillium manginii]KAJ5768077.1 hypothetical protein N7533_000660 [Penicillium manginii]